MVESTLMQNKKVKLGLVGCGRIANNHIKAIQSHNNHIELAALCDPSAEQLQQAALAVPNAKSYNKLEDLLADNSVEIVSLCTPSGLHPEQTILAAKAGKHVITEKPMATNWQDALKMVDVCTQSGVKLFVVKQNRLSSTTQQLKKAIDQGRFGRIYMITVNVFWTRPQNYYDEAKWRGTKDLDGGAFMNQASHYVDLLSWLFGPVQSVQSMMGTMARNIDTEDTGVMTLRWQSGAIGSVNMTMLAYPKNFEGSITILGEKGTVRIGGVSLNKVQHWEFADNQADDEFIRAIDEAAPAAGAGHALYYQNIIDVLNGAADPITDGHAGLQSLELLVAAYRSAENGQAVNLPLELK
jgi:UDP-N-acetyl-2-amino-2-deoxyglucuronate dehydrogenase